MVSTLPINKILISQLPFRIENDQKEEVQYFYLYLVSGRITKLSVIIFHNTLCETIGI